MFNVTGRVAFAILVAAAANICTASEGEIRLKKFLFAHDRVVVRDKESSVISREMVSAYQTSFDGLKEVEKEDFESHLRALYLVALYSGDPQFGLAAWEIFQRAHAAFGISRELAEQTFTLMVRSKLFDNANAISERFGLNQEKFTFENFAVDQSPKSPSLWAIDKSSRKFTKVIFELPAGLTVLVVGHPYCNYSNRALFDIEASETARAVLLPRMQWIIPPSGDFTPSMLAQWNAEHPLAAFRVADNAQDWPHIRRWETPTFYIFKNGVLAKTKIGWPNAEGINELIGLLKEFE